MAELEDNVLDGNAIGGVLIEVFGTEMTTAVAVCGSCGTAGPVAQAPLAYVCGPTNFVEAVAADLVALGYPPQRVKTERFGATGTP